MVILICDGMSVIRAHLERDTSPLSLRNFITKLEIHDGPVIMVWDGPNNRQWRRAHYPEYKRNRKPASADIWTGIEFIKKLLTKTKVIQIEIPGEEADDIIYTIARRFASPTNPVCIDTRDFDLRATCAGRPEIFCTAPPMATVADHHITLYKTFVGDPSDNIKGVPGFGDKAWEMCHPQQLQAIVDDAYAGVWIPERYPAFLKKGVMDWIKANQPLIVAMHTIISMREVFEPLIDQHMLVGTPDVHERNRLLSEWML